MFLVRMSGSVFFTKLDRCIIGSDNVNRYEHDEAFKAAELQECIMPSFDFALTLLLSVGGVNRCAMTAVVS